MRNHQRVLSWLETELESGRLLIGQRLPGERAMAEYLQVSRASVREGVRVLEAMGMVRANVGSGPDAGTIITANPETALAAALRLHIASSHLPVSDIVQTRLLLETWSVAHAGADSPAMADAAELLVRMDDPRLPADEFLVLDAQFHVALAAAAGNILIGAMMASLRESIAAYTRQLTRSLPVWDRTATRLRQEHHGIHAAIVRGASAEASVQVSDHIQGFYREAGMGEPLAS